MKTYRLLGSVALAAVASSFAHAQAYGYNQSGSSINITGVYSAYGAVGGVYTGSLGYTYGFIGPSSGNYGQYAGGMGVYGYYDHVGWGFNGQYGSSLAGNGAWPNGQVISGGYTDNSFEIYNANPFAVTVYFTGITNSSSYAFQTAAGDSAYGEGWSELIFDNYTLMQESFTAVEADNLFGDGNFMEAYSYLLGNGGYLGFYTYGAGSPFAGAIDSYQNISWRLYLGAYGYATFTEFNESVGAATSLRANNGTPAPAAVAPFALGLLGALKRRKKS